MRRGPAAPGFEPPPKAVAAYHFRVRRLVAQPKAVVHHAPAAAMGLVRTASRVLGVPTSDRPGDSKLGVARSHERKPQRRRWRRRRRRGDYHRRCCGRVSSRIVGHRRRRRRRGLIRRRLLEAGAAGIQRKRRRRGRLWRQVASSYARAGKGNGEILRTDLVRRYAVENGALVSCRGHAVAVERRGLGQEGDCDWIASLDIRHC